MINALYIHGWGSKFDPDNEKITSLRKAVNVVGVDVDYCDPVDEIAELLQQAIVYESIDLVVGTSFGGFWAAKIGSELGIPFVAINPVLMPYQTLDSKQGTGTYYDGRVYQLRREVVEQYRGERFNLMGCGLILLDAADEVLDSGETKSLLEDFYDVHMFAGGSHRFDHMDDSVPLIKQHIEFCKYGYGQDET